MMTRIERSTAPLKRSAPLRRRKAYSPFDEPPASELALSYSNGYVTVEISHEALDAYIDSTGDVPLPVVTDPQTGDRRTFDARNNVRVIYDAASMLREVATRTNDGLFLRINFTESDGYVD